MIPAAYVIGVVVAYLFLPARLCQLFGRGVTAWGWPFGILIKTEDVLVATARWLVSRAAMNVREARRTLERWGWVPKE